MAMEREKEREMELESATYTNCLLLGLDPSVIGIGVLNGIPRVGLFRHSNPKLGDHLLHYLISSIRGPSQAAKDFDGVWPICDAGQSKDFRKVVLGVISELEEQGAIPKCIARVSALANCCGIRFVDLLWQISVYALREMHRRTLVSDVASNPLPSVLTDQEISHASALLPVIKARISLERRRFLNNVESAVKRQAKWLHLAHEMTAEFRSLCAEELELERMQEMFNEVQLEEDLSDDIPTCSSQSFQMAEIASEMWDSILTQTSKSKHDEALDLYEVLSSGPIEDLIAHRDHRYRISGSSLLVAMDQSSSQDSTRGISSSQNSVDDMNTQDEPHTAIDWRIHKGLYSPSSPPIKLFLKNDKNKMLFPVADISDVFRRWTHALESIQRQSHLLANANNGEGPELLQRTHYSSHSDHTTFLYATHADHEQHLNNIEVLMQRLIDSSSEMQESVRKCTEQVHTVTSTLCPLTRSSCGSVSLMHVTSTEISDTDVIESAPKSSPRKGSIKLPTLKLPEMFSLTSSTAARGEDNFSVRKLKKSVREAALLKQPQPGKLGSSRGSQSDCGSDHMFTPHSLVRYPQLGTEHRAAEMKSRRSFDFTNSFLKEHDEDELVFRINTSQMFSDSTELCEDDSPTGAASSSLKSFSVMEDPLGEVFSPTLLTDSPLLDDLYEDLLVWKVEHIFREFNIMADELAKYARKEEWSWMDGSSLPLFMSKLSQELLSM